MRLGAYPCVLTPGSQAAAAYGAAEISERHRHRYEVNNEYREALTSHGMVISGVSPDRRLVEMIELPEHPYFVGLPVPPRVQVPAAGAAPAVPVVRRSGAARPSGRARAAFGRDVGARRAVALSKPQRTSRG